MDLEALISLMNEADVAKTALIPLLTDPPETKKADFPLAVQRFMFYSSVLRPLGIALTRSMYRQRGEWNMWFRKHTREPQKFQIIQTPENQRVADAIARLEIIFAHLGIPYYEDIGRLAEKRANVFFDIASTYHVDRRLIRKAVKALGPQKILFGTDIPYAHKDALNMIKGWVENTPLSDIENERIFSGNFREIIDGN